MIDLKLVQKNPELLAKALADRHSSLSVDEFLTLDGRRRALLADFPDAEILQEQRTVTVQNGTAHAEVRYLFTADIAQAAQD